MRWNSRRTLHYTFGVRIRSLTSVLLLMGACTQAPPKTEIIVVGSGAGGGPLAARLAREGFHVLLLEAGQDVGGKANYQVPARHAFSTEDPDMAWWFFVDHHSDERADAQDSKQTPAGILYPRGSALGGSTAVNAMVTVLPSPSDWDDLARTLKEPSWRSRNMAEYERKVREWLSVEIPDANLALDDPDISGALAAVADTMAPDDTHAASLLAGALSRDVNSSLAEVETTGLFRLPLATEEGRRTGTREAIVRTVAEGFPLTVITGAFVTRVLFDRSVEPPRAIGVEYAVGDKLYGATIGPREESTLRKQAFATKEVVLSAGVFNTPQLLKLSGIGPRDELSALGIDVLKHNPWVGQNLQDRYEAAIVTQLERPIALLQDCKIPEAVPDPCMDSWAQGEGVYQTSGFLAAALRKSDPDLDRADLQVFSAVGDVRGYFPGYAQAAINHKDRLSWLMLKAHTKNRDGTVTLATSNPFDRSKIDFNYFDETDPMNDPDLLSIVEAVGFVRDIIAQTNGHYSEQTVTEIWPGPEVQTTADIAAFVRNEAWGHHACCTAPLAASPEDGAIDPSFRVHGVAGLRVVDASVFPVIPGTFIAMPTFMVSEKAAATITEDHR